MSGESKTADRGVEREEWPDGRPRRVVASSEQTRVEALWWPDEDEVVVVVVGERMRVGVLRTRRALPSRIKASVSLSRLAGRGGRGGGGPVGLVKGTVLGSGMEGMLGG